MKITTLYVTLPNLCMGGAERVIVTLLKHIDTHRFEITLISLGYIDPVLTKEIPRDIKILSLGKQSVRTGLWTLIKFIRKNPPDILFSGLSHLNLALSIIWFLMPKKTKIVVRESNVVSKNVKLFPFSVLFKLLYKLFYRRLSLIICQSQEMADDLQQNYNVKSSSLQILRNPLDRVFLFNKANSVIEKTNANNLFVACGRLEFQKGFDILLEALGLLSNIDFELHIIGQGPLNQKLQRQVSNLKLDGKVKFLGFQKNPFPFIKQADLLILSSRFEGMPNVVLEAIALGTPVVSTPAPGGVIELLKDSKVCLLADEISAESLAKSIEHFVARKSHNRPENELIEPYLVETVIKNFEKLLLEQKI